MKKLIFLTAIVFLFTSSADTNWEKTENGVIINLKGDGGKTARSMKVEVLGDKIIHIVASPESDFSSEKSLAVIEHNETNTPFIPASNKKNIVLSTSSIKATISLTTGQVLFSDSDNNLILSEATGLFRQTDKT